ncbi:hypothetical protein HY478_00775 [Candidatus Uhrbacteria bacterium]|nr:hypothetical protein [Candidatus Uhrbacteria bacterium]
MLLSLAASAEAAVPCIKTSFRGDASTYNPNYAGYKTGGQALATGGRYNPNEYEAALQLGLATRYGCGYGSRAICYAIVQAPSGRAMTVRINDNGPLTPGRVIDLNEKSMRYLSAGSYGQNSGVIRNVIVTLLCGIEGQQLGPLEAREREEWANRTYDAPYANTSGYATRPVGVSSGAPAGSGGQTTSPYYPPQTQVPSPQSPGYPITAPPISFVPTTPILFTPLFPFPTTTVPRLPIASASISVQPREVARGETSVVSWSSVGAVSNSCKVSVLSGGRDVLVGQGNKGSRQVQISPTSSTGTLTFTLRCTSLASGSRIERTAILSVK